jgi:hypothetical protein
MVSPVNETAFLPVAVAALALGLALWFAARAQPLGSRSSEERAASRAAATSDRARSASTTLELLGALADQPSKGRVDRGALAPLARDVVQALPEERSGVQPPIDDVSASGQPASRMTPEPITRPAKPPAADG